MQPVPVHFFISKLPLPVFVGAGVGSLFLAIVWAVATATGQPTIFSPLIEAKYWYLWMAAPAVLFPVVGALRLFVVLFFAFPPLLFFYYRFVFSFLACFSFSFLFFLLFFPFLFYSILFYSVLFTSLFFIGSSFLIQSI